MKTKKQTVALVEPKTYSIMESVTHKLEWDTKQALESLSRWRDGFLKNPAHAFSWSDREFEHAARYEAAAIVKRLVTELKEKGDDYVTLSDREIIQKVRDWFRREVVSKAKYPEKSTSAPSNIMGQALTAAKAEWLDSLDDLLANQRYV